MKIDLFKLLAYGPFTDKVLDFSGNGFGLHVVFGPNEAGKSTALRALIGLFYGLGHTTEDAWMHDYSKLAVGASLSLPDKTILNLTRYKRRKNDLINEDTGEPFEQTKLDFMLGNVGKDAFEHAFGISHDSLRQGVGSVLAAGGDLGQALFAATSGINSLKKVMSTLEEQQNKLYKPRAQKSIINAGISRLGALRKEQREVTASHRQWKHLQSRLDDLIRRKKDVSNRLADLTAEISLLSRYRDALQYVTKQTELKHTIEDIGYVPDLSDDFAERRIAAQVGLKEAAQAEQDLIQALAEIEKRLSELFFDPRLLDRASIIETLAGEVHLHKKAMTDSVSLKIQATQLYEAAAKSLDRLRTGLTIDAVDALRISKTDKARIARLGGKCPALEREVTNAQSALETSLRNLEKAKSDLKKLDQPEDTGELMDCLERASEFGNIEQRISEAQTDVTRLIEQAKVEIESLGQWDGNLDDLEKLPIPTEETMRRFEADLVELDKQVNDANKDVIKIEKQLKEKNKALDELTRAGSLPSIDDLHADRNLRDKGWVSVRKVWLDGAQADVEFLAEFPESQDLAEAFELSLVKADKTADVLREDADAVAKAEASKDDIQILKQSLAEAKNEKQSLDTKRLSIWDQWVVLWEKINISPLPPREMAAWSAKVGELKRRAADIRERKAGVNRLRADMEDMIADMRDALNRIREDVPENISYLLLLDMCKRTTKKHDEIRTKWQELEGRINRYEEEIHSGEKYNENAKQNLEDWSKQWAEAITPLGFSYSSSPEDVSDFILALDEVFFDLNKAKGFENRIAAIKTDYEEYSKRVADEVSKLASDLKDSKPEEAAAELNARLLKDKEQRKEIQLLEAEKRKQTSKLAEIKKQLVAHSEALRLLCSEAEVEDPEKLQTIEMKSKSKSKALDRMNTVNERLAELAAGEAIDSFVAQVKNQNPDDLNAKLDRLTSERDGVQQEEKSLIGEIAVAKRDLESIDGESKAATIAEEVEGLTSEIQSDVEYYTRLKLASLVLAKAIERYRKANQSPVLEAASGYFKTMTRDYFEGLRADFDDKGDPIIKAVRPDGQLLTVHQMSDGSREQLFLALRLGGLLRYVRANGPMPFIVDDILVHFDDDRSVAALNALSELSAYTQVVFFTHHKHLVSLAETFVPDETLRIHEL
jgi:uncharacterized protein YhaN